MFKIIDITHKLEMGGGISLLHKLLAWTIRIIGSVATVREITGIPRLPVPSIPGPKISRTFPYRQFLDEKFPGRSRTVHSRTKFLVATLIIDVSNPLHPPTRTGVGGVLITIPLARPKNLHKNYNIRPNFTGCRLNDFMKHKRDGLKGKMFIVL
jgi:hypothetical protein